MKILKWLLIALLVLSILVLGWLYYMGVFAPVKVEEKVMGPYTLAYSSFVGEYKETGKVFQKVYDTLKAASIETTDGIGVYYDDPKTTPKDKLRSDCGAVISQKDAAKASKLLKVMTLKKEKSVVVEFPIKNMFSYMIGPMKVYPVLSKYAQDKGYKAGTTFELYEMNMKNIYFVMQIGK